MLVVPEYAKDRIIRPGVRKHADGLDEGSAEITSKLGIVVNWADSRHGSHVEDRGIVSRMIVCTNFLTGLTATFVGDGDYPTEIQSLKWHVWGTSGIAESASHIGCQAPAAPTTANGIVGTQVDATTTYTTVATITAAGTVTIAEHCVYSLELMSSALMKVDRSAFTGIALSTSDSITFTYVLTLGGS